jgi:hypothetical protein
LAACFHELAMTGERALLGMGLYGRRRRLARLIPCILSSDWMCSSRKRAACTACLHGLPGLAARLPPDKWSGKLPRNRLRGHLAQKDLAHNVMDQNPDFWPASIGRREPPPCDLTRSRRPIRDYLRYRDFSPTIQARIASDKGFHELYFEPCNWCRLHALYHRTSPPPTSNG